MNMSEGKVSKRRKYYTLKMVAPTEQAVEMAKDQVKVIKAVKRRTGQKKRKAVRKKATVKRKLNRKNSKRKPTQKKKKASFALKKGRKPDFFHNGCALF